ncbi:MAG: hypothetical protein FWJ66_02220 [Caldibacillus sp.]
MSTRAAPDSGAKPSSVFEYFAISLKTELFVPAKAALDQWMKKGASSIG